MAETAGARPGVVRFGVFEADFRTGELRKQGVRIKLQEKPFQLLAALVERPGELVTRDELRRRLWGDQTFVDFERGLNIAITKLRTGLGDSAESPRFIETLPRRGYRFVAPIVVADDGGSISRPERSPAGHHERVESKTPALRAGFGSEAPKHRAIRWVMRRRPVLAGTLGIVAVATAAFAVLGVGAKRTARGPLRVESLAVLPIENLSGGPEQEYLADAVTDALISELGKINTLRVISRTSIIPYKGAKKSLPDIGRELRVDAIVEGSVVRSGNQVRVKAQLLDAASDRQLWAHAFERDVRDVTLYADIAEAIGREIHAKIDGFAAGPAARRVDPEAWALYVRGRYLWARGGADNLEKARGYFQQAIDRQSDYAAAYAGLADTYMQLAENEVLHPREAIPKAKYAARRALDLDGSLAEAYTSLGGLACTFEADWSGAEREYTHALEINPSYAIAHQWWGQTLAGLGRLEEAAAEIRRALEIDPVSLRANNAAASVLYLARRYPQSIEQYKKTLELDANYVPAVTGLGRVYTALGQKQLALATLEHAAAISNRASPSLAALGHAYAVFGRTDQALKVLAELRRRQSDAYVSPVDFAIVYLGLRDKDSAFTELQRAAEGHLSSLSSLRASPEYDPLRDDPRFTDLLHRVNLD